ncbi:hypothetical protein EJ08DRAFT_691305 [Tothia fuscella]|uniref:WD repeat protein n=1 Tax=Tothia fuscella TaxID=1048955 RepID=A0A9P4U5H5_9PEZI|nr:hypothetical protein EJ08DRAFT_691305 [Tothia fuscella]
MPNTLRNVCSHTPVTALATSNGLIFSASGPCLRTHSNDAKSPSAIATKRIFKSQIIHGMTVQHDEDDASWFLLVWGGRYLATLLITREAKSSSNLRETLRIRRSGLAKIDDWILDVSFNPNFEAACTAGLTQVVPQAVALTANNVLYEVCFQGNWAPEQQHFDRPLVIKELTPGPRCILYSAHLKWSSHSEIIVASGTALGEIYVWMYLADKKNMATGYPHVILSGHEGSVFGVRISRPIDVEPGRTHRFLTSCSDDRTIRVWDITEVLIQSNSVDGSTIDHKRAKSRTTGFLSDLTEDSIGTSKDKCTAVAMGHISRIWNIQYAFPEASQKDKGGILSIMSVGEDASCQKWNLMFDPTAQQNFPNGKFALIHSDTAHYHTGKNIWALALNSKSNEPEDARVLTGGADSSIITTLMSRSKNSEQKRSNSFEIEDVLQVIFPSCTEASQQDASYGKQMAKRRNKDLEDCFRSYTHLGDNSMLVTTNNGLVLLATCQTTGLGSPSRWDWRLLTQLNGLKGYSVVCNIPNSEFSFLGGARGSVFVFNYLTCEVTLVTNVQGKIANLFVQPTSQGDDIFATLLVVQVGGLAPMQLLLQRSDDGSLLIASRVILSMDQNLGVITSYAHAYQVGDQKVFLGFRDGGISIIFLNGDKPSVNLARAHGREAVTGLRSIQSGSNGMSIDYLLSVGRDGTCTIHCLGHENQNPLLVHKLTLPFGPNIEGVYYDPPTGSLCVYGFHGRNFVLYDLISSESIMTIECGGAHRIWTFKPYIGPRGSVLGGSFAWTKACVLNIYYSFEPDYQTITSGSHGREIKTCAVAPNSLLGGPYGLLFATGAEDTDIRLSVLGEEDKLINLATLRKHVTGIQSLEWSEDGSFLFSCGGYEEFFVWRLRATPGVMVGVVCESSCPKENVKSDLRIMSFAVREHPEEEDHGRKQGIDYRFLVVLAYSNSVIKLWQYTSHEGRGSWALLVVGNYTSACITAIELIAVSGTIVVLTAATDAHVSIWDVPKECFHQIVIEEEPGNFLSTRMMTCYGVLRVHQNCIKSMSTQTLGKDATLVLTTGDDNAIGFSLARFDGTTGVLVMSSLCVPKAHAAAVNAASVVSVHNVEEGKIRMLAATASNDQRVKTWHVEIDLAAPGVDGVNITRGANEYSAIADISSLAVFSHDKVAGEGLEVLICGVGIEIWRIGS